MEIDGKIMAEDARRRNWEAEYALKLVQMSMVQDV
jgi:hypothetical protein